MMNDTKKLEYQTVLLGALLHDIGKYLHRGKDKTWGKGKHPKVGANFVEEWKNLFSQCVNADLLKTLVQRHHDNPRFPEELRIDDIEDEHTRALARLISQADHMASSERAEKADHYQNYRTTALTNPFYKVQLL
jgi:CRISPR-associated protein Csm1